MDIKIISREDDMVVKVETPFEKHQMMMEGLMERTEPSRSDYAITLDAEVSLQELFEDTIAIDFLMKLAQEAIEMKTNKINP